MADLDKIIGNLEGLTWDDWHEWHSDSEVTGMAQDAMALLIKQAMEIEKLTNYINGFSCDAVPVVRCKECRRWRPLLARDGCGRCMADGIVRVTTPEWFCADGKRRQKGENK